MKCLICNKEFFANLTACNLCHNCYGTLFKSTLDKTNYEYCAMVENDPNSICNKDVVNNKFPCIKCISSNLELVKKICKLNKLT